MKTSSSRTSKRCKPKTKPRIVPVSTVTQSRAPKGTAPMFAATWGLKEKLPEASTIGRLRRIHRDILDYLIAFGKPTRTNKGNVMATFETSRFFAAKGKANGKKSREWLRKRLKEIASTPVEVTRYTPGEAIVQRDIIEPILQRVEIVHAKSGKITAVVWFGPEYLRYVANEMHVNSEKLVLATLRLKHDVTAMIVRWLLSHSVNQRHGLDELIYAVGVPKTAAERTMRKHRSQVLEESCALESGFGITVVELADGRTGLDYPRLQAVWFIDPVKAAAREAAAAQPPKTQQRHDIPRTLNGLARKSPTGGTIFPAAKSIL